MKKISLLLIVLMSVYLIGCTNETTSKPIESATEPEQSEDYSAYLGEWVLDGELPYLMTGLQGGLGMNSITFTSIEGNKAKGVISCVSGAPSFRLAEAEFEGEIIDNVLHSRYEEDGWLNKGDITLTLYEEAVIEASITQDKSEQASMWGIMVGDFVLVPPINTELISTASFKEEEILNLESRLSLFGSDFIEPFTEVSLEDSAIINFLGMHIALGSLDDHIETEDGHDKIVFDQSVMENLSVKYFGREVIEHQTVGSTVFEDGKYLVPALGGVSDWAKVNGILQLTDYENLYFVLVDFVFQGPDDEKETFINQYVMLVEDLDNPIVLELNKIESPIESKMIVEFIEQALQ